MKEKLNIFLIISLFCLISSLSMEDWRDYPTCRLGRLQSPIDIKEYESTYANNFSFVYQSYNKINVSQNQSEDNYADVYDASNGGYINFERGGVIKQYELVRFEIYPGIHSIDGDKGDFELHLFHKKNLDFITNKNQYRSIQDANMFLVVVLRYKDSCENVNCISDSGLLKSIYNKDINFDLNKYSIFQDKRAYFYEGSLLHIPCDENVNYYVVKDFFFNSNIKKSSFKLKEGIPHSDRFGRPVYKNFMNYKEVLKSNFISMQKITLFLLIFILF